jgi:hypothetical protein
MRACRKNPITVIAGRRSRPGSEVPHLAGLLAMTLKKFFNRLLSSGSPSLDPADKSRKYSATLLQLQNKESRVARMLVGS